MKIILILAVTALSVASCGGNSNTENKSFTDSTSIMASDSALTTPVDTMKPDTVNSGMDTMNHHHDSTKTKDKKKKAL
jgi:uncharacterized protein YcfL